MERKRWDWTGGAKENEDYKESIAQVAMKMWREICKMSVCCDVSDDPQSASTTREGGGGWGLGDNIGWEGSRMSPSDLGGRLWYAWMFMSR